MNSYARSFTQTANSSAPLASLAYSLQGSWERGVDVHQLNASIFTFHSESKSLEIRMLVRGRLLVCPFAGYALRTLLLDSVFCLIWWLITGIWTLDSISVFIRETLRNSIRGNAGLLEFPDNNWASLTCWFSFYREQGNNCRRQC